MMAIMPFICHFETFVSLISLLISAGSRRVFCHAEKGDCSISNAINEHVCVFGNLRWISDHWSSLSPLSRCTCTSCFAVLLISIPRVFVIETLSLRTSWWTRRRPFSNSVTSAGKLCAAACSCSIPLSSFLILSFLTPPQCKAVSSRGAKRVLYLLTVLSCPRAHLWCHWLHIQHRHLVSRLRASWVAAGPAHFPRGQRRGPASRDHQGTVGELQGVAHRQPMAGCRTRRDASGFGI